MLKKLFIIFALLLFVPAQGMTADKWSKQDIALEITYQVLHFIDWRQTRYIAKHPRYWHEVNPILGKHPSVNAVDKYFLITTTLHAAITHYLRQKDRIWWQGLFIIISGTCVMYNASVGIKMDF